MRLNRELIGILLLVLLFVLAGLWMGGRSEGKSRLAGREATHDPSVYNDRASGSKAFYEWVKMRGYATEVWHRSWDKLDQSKAAVLIAVAPSVENKTATLTGGPTDDIFGGKRAPKTALSSADAGPLRNWLSKGHTLILMTTRLGTGRVVNSKDSADTFGDALDLIVESPNTTSAASDFPPIQPVVDVHGVTSVHLTSGMRIRRLARDSVTLFGDANGPVVSLIPVGKGRIIAIADDGFASNVNLPRSENAIFLDNILAHYAGQGSTILFDEFHHGSADLSPMDDGWTALGRPLQLALIQLLLACVIMAIVLGARFGAPVPLLRGVQRTSSEYVASLANLYRSAGASTMALELIYRSFLRELTNRFALNPDISLEQLAEDISRRGNIDRSRIRQVLASCEQHIDSGRITEGALLDLVRQMDSIRKDIGIV